MANFALIFVADKCTVQSVNTCQQEKIPPKTEKKKKKKKKKINN
jgi:hypothetical protein